METLTYFLEMRRTLPFGLTAVSRNAMFRLDGRGIWLGLHAGQALPAKRNAASGRRHLDAKSDPPLPIDQPEFDWYYAELYVAPIRRVVRVAKDYSCSRMMRCGNISVEAVTIASIAAAEAHGRRWVLPTHSLRCRGEEVRFATLFFVAIVEIEENLAHVAAWQAWLAGDVRAP